jgi:hypothetical protein
MNMSSKEPYFFLSVANLKRYLLLQVLQTDNLWLYCLECWGNSYVLSSTCQTLSISKMNESAGGGEKMSQSHYY